MVEKCGICEAEDAKYKCPKCGVKYCSLACYKDTIKHQDPTEGDRDEQIHHIESKKASENSLASPKWSKIFSETPELQRLLQYNTVKFHLAKVYRILCGESLDSNESGMNSEMKRQLAVDYLNTLRYGGIHYNEAIEEFCGISLARLEQA
ncbi:HIT1 (YJR055W) [Zygosaccharomyces parabailii]|nr:HIT1 (YJR055W) [Zygosaccharomyces parabailii]CDH09177.1 related to Protein HIT1 [Zygosaccharomyces bailii ISA1307]